MELNLQDVELLSHNGNIKRSDFIEYALETKGRFQKREHNEPNMIV